MVTCRVGGHILNFCVPSGHPPARAEEWWDSTGSRDRVVVTDADGRLGEAPTPLLRSFCRPDFDDNGCSPLDFMHDWDMEAPASFEPLPLSTWTSRAGKEREIDFVQIPSARHDVVPVERSHFMGGARTSGRLLSA